MSENSSPGSNSVEHAESASSAARPETQGERWIKYGSNAVLASVLVIVIVGLLTYIAQRNTRRIDTTASGVYSLKPQTKAVIGDLKSKVTLVSLYTKTKPVQNTSDEGGENSATLISDPGQTVADLLEEYRRAGKNIDVQIIDPVNEKDKLAALHDQLVRDYGSQIQGYKTFLAEWDKYSKELAARLTAQAAEMNRITGGGALATDENEGANEVPGLQPDVVSTVKVLPKWLNEVQEDLDHERSKKYPDWKAAVSSLKDFLTKLSADSEGIAQRYAKFKDNKSVAENIRKFMAENQPRYLELKKQADDLIARSDKLGVLKVDQLEQALNVQNPILVLGPSDWRILQYNQVWSADAVHTISGGKVRPRFAGEQLITGAIYALTNNKKPKLCFVRPGGQPLTNAGFPGLIRGGPLAPIAERMREYGFEVTEKDLSGTWAMQAQMQQMPTPPEPSDAEIKDAIWFVVDVPAGGGMQGMPPPQIAPKIKDHLDHGGAALIFFEPQSDDLKSALDEWGIDLHPEAMALHEPINLTEGSPTDMIEQAKARPQVFVLNTYGDHPITKPVKNLDSVWVQAMVVRTHEVKDASVTPLFLMDSAFPGYKVWGETSLEAMTADKTPAYDKSKDLAPPIYCGAAAEKKNGNRVVVIGSPIMWDGLINIGDPVASERLRRPVLLFPGNGEITANSLFWLAHLEPMIAISPAAMDVSRIGDMSNSKLMFWRYGVLLIILPGLVLVSGLFVYASRRD